MKKITVVLVACLLMTACSNPPAVVTVNQAMLMMKLAYSKGVLRAHQYPSISIKEAWDQDSLDLRLDIMPFFY